MSELEELPSWAGRAASQPPEQTPPAESDPMQQPPQGEDRRRRPWMTALLVLFGLLALLAMGGIGYLLANSEDSTTEASADQADETTVDDSQLNSEQLTADGDDGADATAADAGEEDGGTTTEEGTDGASDEDVVTVEVDGDAEADATDQDGTATDGEVIDSGRQAIFRGGKVYLSGAVPSEEVGQFIEQKAAAVVGPDNVVNEYTIDPDTVIEEGESAPLYVEDVILFEFNSVAIAPPFFPILDLGTLLLSQNPQASVTVITRTDAVGSEEVNLEVSTARANAVIDYWLDKGVNPDQIKADPRGEELASDDDDEETAAKNRRAEFVITGLLD